MSEVAWLIPVLPALAAALIFAVGKRLPAGGAEIGIGAAVLALGVSGMVAFEVFTANAEAAAAGTSAFLYERGVTLATFGADFSFEAGIRIDGLAAMMFLLVTFVSLMVQVYSTGYMHGDSRYTWYFTLLSLFTASMLLLVIANNLLLLLVGWELVGVCSFLLIGFWWEEKRNSDAAIKAFITTKFGDVGLIVGVVTLWSMFATFDIGEIIATVEAGDFNQGLLTFALLMLFLGCVGKSAQFPLHTWLPDAMAGPTPVSALIHAATMVTAGVFLIARLFPLFSASAVAQAVVAAVGAVTLVSAGLLAIVQDDIKRVLAYSTVSQLGYMVAALAFSYTAGIFHLFTHGFFKALLFLGAGSLIHAAHSNNMSDMGGMRRAMPWTFATFLIGSLALMAAPPLAGFWSKDEILVEALGAGSASGYAVFALGAVGGLLTAFYMTRALLLVFAGSYRGEGGVEHLHESPPAMVGPLVALAVPSVLIGLINLPLEPIQELGVFSAWTMFSVEYWATHPVEFSLPVAGLATGLAAVGVAIGWSLYRAVPERDPVLHMGPLTTVLVNKYYLDRLYTDVIARSLVRDKLARGSVWLNDRVLDRVVYLAGAGTVRTGRATYDQLDQRGIDGLVNGLGSGARWVGGIMRVAQSGNVQLYAGAMFVGVIVLGILFAVAS